MLAFARFRLPGDVLHELVPGDIIGRAWSATLKLADPWISEAHAMVSLRDGQLKLLGLRGKFTLGKQPLTELVLAAGLKIHLSRKTQIECVDVHVPRRLLAIEHPALGRFPLLAPRSLKVAPQLDFAAGADPDSPLVTWSDGQRWFARLADGHDEVLEAGRSLSVADHIFTIIALDTDDSGQESTVEPRNAEPPLHLIVKYDSVHIQVRDQVVVLDGIPARILSDLAIAGVPMCWRDLATELWKNERDINTLRRNWDAAIARLRRKLRLGNVRVDLVRTDHAGNFELLLTRRDRIEDRT